VNVILFGATGMVGQGVLRECLLDPDVTRVLSVARSSTCPPVASSWTPDRAWTALRVEATRVTVCRWASSSAAEVVTFTIGNL